MAKIKILSEAVYSQIKAGEVIERPASIISELIDNAIDAGSDEISIKVEEGGLKKIIVSDNGSGIEKEDMMLTLAMHATSKIEKADDLLNIKTMGFRGEALYSIQSVSKIHISSNTDASGKTEGYSLSNSGPDKLKVIPVAFKRGTKVEVQDIFYNTPVRKKFLKSATTEFNNIKRTVQSKAFSHLNISFTLFNNNEIIYKTKGDRDFDKTFFSINNKENKFKIYNYSKVFSDNLKISIYHTSPEVFFPVRKYQMFFVNNRPVTASFFYSALDTGYKNYISPGRFPLIFVYLEINPNEIDINIHPTKKEVKFLNQENIFQSLHQIINEAMNKIITREIFLNPASTYESNFTQSNLRMFNEDKKTEYFNEVVFKEKDNFNDNKFKKELDFNILGVAFETYIVIEKNNQILFIDQHAACEAIIFAKKKEKYLLDNSKESLVIPIIFDIDNWNDKIKEKINLLNRNNFLIEEEEGTTLSIKEAPSILLNNKNYDLIVEIIKNILEEKDKLDEENIIESVLAQISCKEAVKKGDKLSLLEIGEIAKEYFKYNITNCPHGRPTHFELSKDSLEKIFQRKK